MAAGLLQMVPGSITNVYADDSVIWIEPVARDYGRPWKKKTADPSKNEKHIPRAARSDPRERSGRPEGARGTSSPAAPKNGDAKAAKRRGSMGHAMRRKRKTYLSAGVFPRGAAGQSGPYLSQTRAWLELPDNRLMPLKLRKKRGRYRLDCPYGTGGVYRLISYNGDHVQNGVRQHLYAYYSFMAHGDKPDKKPRKHSFRPGFQGGKPKLEIVRFYDRERHRYRSRAGHKL
ncbi:MAG: hypothetical protein P8Y36_08690, partial [Alphaproteobacteria bacterium]